MKLVIICAFALPVLVLTIDYTNNAFLDAVGDRMPAQQNASIQAAWQNNVDFWNNSLAAIFFLFAIIAIGLTIFLASHPFLLIAWIFFNLIILWLHDALMEVLSVIIASPLNTGAMDVAIGFIQTDMISGIVIINIILGAVLFGKRAMFS